MRLVRDDGPKEDRVATMTEEVKPTIRIRFQTLEEVPGWITKENPGPGRSKLVMVTIGVVKVSALGKRELLQTRCQSRLHWRS
jgi:hypothetical protein